MKKLLLFVLLLFVFASMIVFALKSCDTNPQTNDKAGHVIDTLAMIEKINSYEIQPIDRIEVFQVFEGKQFSREYGNYYRCCLAETYKFNSKKKSSWNDGYEIVNKSSMIYIFDESVLLYDDLKISANDFIMVGTYTYDTKPKNLFGMEIPSERLTVPVYVRKSELLELYRKNN